MGSSGLKSKNKSVESISLTTLFEKMCPIYMSYGMSYDEYWYESPYRVKFYREAYELKQKKFRDCLQEQSPFLLLKKIAAHFLIGT